MPERPGLWSEKKLNLHHRNSPSLIYSFLGFWIWPSAAKMTSKDHSHAESRRDRVWYEPEKPIVTFHFTTLQYGWGLGNFVINFYRPVFIKMSDFYQDKNFILIVPSFDWIRSLGGRLCWLQFDEIQVYIGNYWRFDSSLSTTCFRIKNAFWSLYFRTCPRVQWWE